MIASAWATMCAAAKQWREDFDPDITKARWMAASKNFARILGRRFNVIASKVSFNAGGPGVSGEVIAFYKFENNRMMYLHISADFHGYFREVSSFTDYTGKANNNFRLTDSIDDLEARICSAFKLETNA